MTINKSVSKENNKDSIEKLKFFEDICRKNGLKITPQRIEIYRQLCFSLDHPSATKIYQKLRKSYSHISLDTVNRNLVAFYRIGAVEIVEGSGDPKRFDSNLTLHHHFRCIKCNKLIDIYNEDFDKAEVPEELKATFTILRKRVYLEGVCQECKNKR